MYNVLLAIKSKSLLMEARYLHVWGDSTGFVICGQTDDFVDLIDQLKRQVVHLLLLEDTPDHHTISILREIKKQNLCSAVAVVSETADFKTVRQSFLLGVDDYFVTPFEANQWISLFSRIENAAHGKIAEELCRQEELVTYFENVDFSIKAQLDELFYHVIAEYRNTAEAVLYLKRVIDGVLETLFDQYAWLENYFDRTDFSGVSYDYLKYEDRIKKILEDFYAFFVEFSELCPPHGEKLDEILRYILQHPDGQLKQKTISEELFINRSYLSTVFNAQIGVNFVDYVNTVKLKRAAYLLRHTNKKIADIAALLDYRDMGYFLKRFKARYGVTPSQYRLPESWDYQI